MPSQTEPGIAGAGTFSPAMAEAHNYIGWILSTFVGRIGGRILEVGLGHGSYYPQLRPLGDYTGLDRDPAMIAAARRRFPEGQFLQADIAQPDLSGRIGHFDSIVCLNVLEHIEDDRSAIAGLSALLNPGGHLCILTPALPLLYGDLDRLAGHHRRYTLGSMRTLLRVAGGEIVLLHYFNGLGGLGWLLNRWMRHRSLAAAGVNRQIALFDRYLVPIARASDRLFRRWFGQSVVCVMRSVG